MKTIYIADDGKEFDDEDDCKDYEGTQRLKNSKGIKFYNEDLELITDTRGLDDVYYAFVKTDKDAAEARDIINEWVGMYAFKTVTHAGYWMYRDDKDDFAVIDDEIRKQSAWVGSLRRIKTRLESAREDEQ